MKETVVFFDVDDTLLDNYKAFNQTLLQLWPKRHFSQLQLVSMYRAFRMDSENSYRQVQENKRFNSRTNYARWVNLLDKIGEDNQPVLLQRADQLYHKYQHQGKLAKEWINLFIQLQKQGNVYLGIFTNGFQTTQQRKIAQLDLERYISPEWIFISEAFGDAKPNISCFEKLKACLPVTVDQFIYLGDSYRNDIYPALSAGWQPIWFNRFYEKQKLKGIIERATVSEVISEIQQII